MEGRKKESDKFFRIFLITKLKSTITDEVQHDATVNFSPC